MEYNEKNNECFSDVSLVVNDGTFIRFPTFPTCFSNDPSFSMTYIYNLHKKQYNVM